MDERSENLAKFDTWDLDKNGGITLIMDLKLASHGLTIISATHVYFLNPVWKKTQEAQAIKRAHRIGQTKEVFVEILILKNTIEEEMYYKRADGDDDLKSSKNTELIDDSGMQEYIMRYEFLKMFDGTQDEFAPVRAPTTNLNTMKLNDLGEDDDTIMRSCVGTVKADHVRDWSIPVFSEANMGALIKTQTKVDKVGESQRHQLDLQNGSDNLNNSVTENGGKTATSALNKLRLRKKTVRFT
ncbi:unnamed protein product [Ambrosiozyma monospora]|uniref:Unnamed protein product n=1 Tax=Ambrosiozyma monospora TaxID=43982 RepID=A0ACB5TYI4_AMBMO|nr:unnamed protein product [Ambrosiozyma monospora]